jgi:hypothetical protein
LGACVVGVALGVGVVGGVDATVAVGVVGSGVGVGVGEVVTAAAEAVTDDPVAAVLSCFEPPPVTSTSSVISTTKPVMPIARPLRTDQFCGRQSDPRPEPGPGGGVLCVLRVFIGPGPLPCGERVARA